LRVLAPIIMLQCAACSADPVPDACLALRPYLPIQVEQADTVPTKKAVLRANIAHNEACSPPVIKPWSTTVAGAR